MFDSGVTGFLIVMFAMVILMTPALALFYGGFSRRKNVVNIMTLAFIPLGIVSVLWVVLGDSLAFGGPAAYDADGAILSVPQLFFGGFDRMFGAGVTSEAMTGVAAYGESAYPYGAFSLFQLSAAVITMAIVCGSLADRVKLSSMVLITILWPIFIYVPICHMAWGGGLIGSGIGAVDFGGGYVVHISAGVSGLILCRMLGARLGLGKKDMPAHNIPFVMIATGILWFGWFAFLGGASFAADGVTTLAVYNCTCGPAAALITWMAIEKKHTGKVTMVGMCTAVLEGLVVVTPGASMMEPWVGLLLGVLIAFIGYFMICIAKPKLGYDDAFDAFGVHGVAGTIGILAIGFFALPELSGNGNGGLFVTGDALLLGQEFLGLLVVYAWLAVFVPLLGLITKALCKGSLRVNEATEEAGLDSFYHEPAYPAFEGHDPGELAQ